jgi:hypothetical protein
MLHTRTYATRWRSWLRHYATSRKIACSHYGPGVYSVSNRMSTRNLSWGKVRPARKSYNLTTISKPIVQKMWERGHLTTLLAPTACYRDSFAFTHTNIYYIENMMEIRVMFILVNSCRAIRCVSCLKITNVSRSDSDDGDRWSLKRR